MLCSRISYLKKDYSSERQSDRERRGKRRTEVARSSIRWFDSPDAHSSQGWARPKPDTETPPGLPPGWR